jgi:hypothetical protein
MDLGKDDLAVLCEGMTREQVDRVHRLLHEWSVGPAESFPTQLSLLSLTQLRAAASVPRSLANSRKWLELHLTEYRRQSQIMADDFAASMDDENKEFKKSVENYVQATRQAVQQIQAQLADAESVAKRVKALMENAVIEWGSIKANTTTQCERLEQISNDLRDRFAWRVMLRWVAWFLLALGYGVCIGHYWFH